MILTSQLKTIFLFLFLFLNLTHSLKVRDMINFREKIKLAQPRTINTEGSLIETTLPFANYEHKKTLSKNFDLNSNQDVLNISYLDLMKVLGRNNHL